MASVRSALRLFAIVSSRPLVGTNHLLEGSLATTQEVQDAKSAIVGATLTSLVLTGSASAQGVGIYLGPGPGAYVYDDDYYDAPAYGYVAPRVYTERRVIRPAGHCGTYHYWNGAYCADARNR
jgi:hypothetical protein